MIIYKAIFPNEKVYIGKTINFESRKYQHIWNSKRKENSHIIMYKAIRKYGADNIKWEIIHECSSLKEMKEKEKEFINLYKSTEHEYGYNMVCGDKEEYILRDNFDESYRIDIIKRKLKSNGHDPEKYVVIDENLEIKIIEDYKNLIGIRALSKKYGISRQRLRRFLLSKNIEIDKEIVSKITTFVPSIEIIKDICDNFKSGKTIKSIAYEKNLTIMITSRILHDSGVRISKRFKNGKRYDGKQPKKRELNNSIG
jgi:hypothetical protein